MTKQEVLAELNFGQRIAEDEADTLSEYFVETDQWRKLLSGEADIVYGPKGSGKSALYSLLRTKIDDLRTKRIVLFAGEVVRGTPVFQDLVLNPPTSEEQFRGRWKLYFLTLLGNAFQFLNLKSDHAKAVIKSLEEAGLLIPADFSLRRMLKAVLDYVKRIELSGEVKYDPLANAPQIGGKVTLREPGTEEQRAGFVSADTLLESADKALADIETKVWIIRDRLDVAFADSADLERNGLRALFRV